VIGRVDTIAVTGRIFPASPQESAMSHDDRLQKAVLAELDWDPSVPAGHIGVTANNGVVTLSGHAGSYAAKYAAERAAARVEGVKAVAEEIEVQLEDRFKRGDEAIASAIVGRLSWDTTVPHDSVKVQVEDGWVSLRGEVRWHFQKDAAEAAVRTLAGVVGVINHVTLKPRVDVTDVSNDIRPRCTARGFSMATRSRYRSTAVPSGSPARSIRRTTGCSPSAQPGRRRTR
jgi:osmotically-inducible protein OsmY